MDNSSKKAHLYYGNYKEDLKCDKSLYTMLTGDETIFNGHPSIKDMWDTALVFSLHRNSDGMVFNSRPPNEKLISFIDQGFTIEKLTFSVRNPEDGTFKQTDHWSVGWRTTKWIYFICHHDECLVMKAGVCGDDQKRRAQMIRHAEKWKCKKHFK